jgi:SecD/SecF fusion protein
MGIMLIMIIPFCNSQTTEKNERTTLKSITKNTSEELLAESKDILQKRLEFMGLRKFQIIQNNAAAELVITVKDTINRETLLDILLLRGHVNFYETMNRQQALNRFGKNSMGCVQDAFFSLHVSDSLHLPNGSILGYAGANDTNAISECFASKNVKALFPKKLELLWTVYAGDSKQFFLYCISESDKTFNEQNISEAHPDYSDPEHPVLSITFKEKVWNSLKYATIRNMNKPIALVIDSKVYFAPRIMGEIPHGKISLSGGGFSKTEVRKLAAILSNGALPLKFIITANK